jgi:hypothetical protein
MNSPPPSIDSWSPTDYRCAPHHLHYYVLVPKQELRRSIGCWFLLCDDVLQYLEVPRGVRGTRGNTKDGEGEAQRLSEKEHDKPSGS